MQEPMFQLVEEHFEIYEEINDDNQVSWIVAIACGNEEIAKSFKNQILKQSKIIMEIKEKLQQ